jgi:RNA polymerase sigma-70 factor (ECF subfamily)
MSLLPGAPQRGEDARDEAFSRVFAHRSMLHAYISALVRDPVMVEDTLSDVVIEIVHSWDRYDKALPFANWARGVARRVAFANLRRRGRAEVGLSDSALEAFASALDALGDQAALESRKERLRGCMEKLSATNRDLLHMRYFDELTSEAIAERLGRSVGAIYTAFSRIHAALLRCLQEREPA